MAPLLLPSPRGQLPQERMKDLRGVSFKTAGGEEVQTDAKKMKRSQSKALLERCGSLGGAAVRCNWGAAQLGGICRTLQQLPAPQKPAPALLHCLAGRWHACNLQLQAAAAGRDGQKFQPIPTHAVGDAVLPPLAASSCCLA